MSEEFATVRTPEIIAAEIKMYCGTILTSYLEIGRRLKEAKSLLPHGEFGKWVEEKCGLKKSSANDCMRVFDAYGAEQGSLFGAELKLQTYGNLNFSQALALLALPENEREEFVKSHDMEDMSTRQLREEIKELKNKNQYLEEQKKAAVFTAAEARKETAAVQEKAKAEMAELAEENRQQAREIAELKERPVEVAVEVDQEAIDKAVSEAIAEAETQHEKALTALQKIAADAEKKAEEAEAAREKAEKAAKKAKDKLKETEADAEAKIKAAEDTSEAEKLRGELAKLQAEADGLKKQLAMSGELMVSFKERFGQWQADYAKINEVLAKMDEETAEKCRAAMKAQVGAWVKKLEDG